MEKKEKKTILVKRPVKKIEVKDEVIRVRKHDTMNNIIGRHYGRYNKKIFEIVKKANPGLNISKLSIGQKINLPYIEDVQKKAKQALPQFDKKSIEKTTSIIDPVKITKVEALYNDKWIYIEGEILNKSEKSVKFLKINIDFMDETDKIIDKNFTYVIKNKELKKGNRKSFKMVKEFSEDFKKYQVWVEYY